MRGKRQGHHGTGPVGTNRCPWSLNPALKLQEFALVGWLAGNRNAPPLPPPQLLLVQGKSYL